MFTNLVRNSQPTELHTNQNQSRLHPSVSRSSGLLTYSVTAPFRVKRFGYTAPILGQILRATANGTATKIFALAVADRLDKLKNSQQRSHNTKLKNVSKTIAILNRIWRPPLLRLDHHIAYYATSGLARCFTTTTNTKQASENGETNASSAAAVSATEKLKQIFRQHDKIESYFCAIGGQTDAPPPNLTSEQVTAILRTNESLVINKEFALKNEKFMQNFSDVYQSTGNYKNHQQQQPPQQQQPQQFYKSIDNPWVTSIECNQLASNHPIEDRLRVSTLHLDAIFEGEPSSASTKKSPPTPNDSCMAFGVFDGHNGGLCADIIAKRLFNYIAIALKILELRGSSPKQSFNRETMARMTSDHNKAPSQFYHQLRIVYQDDVASELCERIEEFEWRSLEKFASEELLRSTKTTEETASSKNSSSAGALPKDDIEAAIRRAFIACDQDLSREIEFNLVNTNSNVLLHYYLSLAVSGSCATVSLIYQNRMFIASTGDCRAVLGTFKQVEVDDIPTEGKEKVVIKKKILKTNELLDEHNSENLKELRRLTSEHPEEEKNYIIRDNRLLGQLMPLRAFGDFSFKWSVAKMRKLGLTKAFGSHIIAAHYRTPPYLTAEPETMTLNLAQEDSGLADSSDSDDPGSTMDRFVILATDGLWEQFESTRKVVKSVNRYRQNMQKQLDAFNSDSLFKVEEPGRITLGEIVDRMRARGVGDETKQLAGRFERITADDDLIEDINCGTFLMRDALSAVTAQRSADEERFSHHVDQYENQRARHSKLVSFLTLPQSVVRNFRDDISLIVIGLKSP